jgi:benzoylformate decarboxylase
MDMTEPAIDFVGLARSLGVKAERAARLGDALGLIEAALGSPGPTLIEVELDRSYGPV